MKPMSESAPGRPIRSLLKPARALLRASRIIKHKLLLGRKLQLGSNVIFGKRAVLHPPDFMRLGDNVHFANFFLTEVNLEVGSDVLFSTRVACIGNDHAFDDPMKTIISNGRLPAGTIVLEGDNLIGFGTIIVGNVRIGRGCIVGAGSVVTRDLPPYTVCAGIPAKPIRPRFGDAKSSSAVQSEAVPVTSEMGA
jgi:acetyltransferase-like isoleucine patch superfamily enzyme